MLHEILLSLSGHPSPLLRTDDPSPHALSTIAYTATVLANASSLALGTPKYDRAQLTLPAGFNGRDGVFRFLSDGRSEYALVVKQVGAGGATVVDGPKL